MVLSREAISFSHCHGISKLAIDAHIVEQYLTLCTLLGALCTVQAPKVLDVIRAVRVSRT